MISRRKERKKEKDDFSQFKNKIFFRTVLMIVLAVVLLYLFYESIVYGRFANLMVGWILPLFLHDADMAYEFYGRYFRNYTTLYLLLAAAIFFFVIFRIYLNWFTRYFQEINRGIDTLTREDEADVSLSPELSSTEKKINAIRHTLQKRKLDAQISEQKKNDLVMYLAHDLKTPLASVIGYLNLLHDEKEISEDLREKYLGIALEKAERLEDLINEFFEITRFNLSSIVLQYHRINLTRMLEQLSYEFQPIFREKNLSCSLQITKDVMISCDPDKLQRIFDNLLRNAVIYSYPDSEIRIWGAEKEESVHLKFINRGDTIPPEKLDRIFEQFYRLDSSRSTKSGGAGLGLAIARQIVQLHGGTLTAQSERDTITFEVVLPLHGAEQPKDKPEAS